ncbi:hypothetical protein CB1_001112007 [Camelus ferus]|nr:hypothetical protein CB1_001112007 [Camelus ferus]
MLGLAGRAGALEEDTFLLKFFSMFLGRIVFLELAAGILAFVFKDWVGDQLNLFINKVKAYRDDLDLQNLTDFAQERWSCCAARGPVTGTSTSSLQVTLEDGHIELSTRDSRSPIFTSPQTYMDGSLHYVSVISDNSGLRLLIDDQPLKNNQRLRGLSDSQQSLRLGGGHFEGCISNVFVRRLSEAPEVLDLASKSTKRDVSLGGCSLNEPPFLMLLKGSTRFNKAQMINIDQPLRDTPAVSPRSLKVWTDAQSCPPPLGAQASHRALRFGNSATSHLLFMLPQELLKSRLQFAVDVQTTSSRGLLFYAGAKNSFMALYLSKGRLVFALGAEGKKLKLKSKEKCSDGKWHTKELENACVFQVTASVGSEASGISTSVTPQRSLCDGQWHSVAVTVKQHILHLELDADNNYTAGRLPLPPARTRERLHIGGVPGKQNSKRNIVSHALGVLLCSKAEDSLREYIPRTRRVTAHLTNPLEPQTAAIYFLLHFDGIENTVQASDETVP